MGWVEKTNMAVAKSVIGYRFRLEFSGHRYERKGSRFLTEMRAGVATFFAMAYIISVHASIMKDTGGTCKCAPSPALKDPYCLDPTNPSYVPYEICKGTVFQDMVTATAAIAALSSFCMGVFANMPIALAPGMGMNAYFAYQVVGRNGQGSISYELALTVIFVEGLVFVALSVLGLRQWLACAIPTSLKIASGTGIGLYLAFIGLTYSSGIGLVTGDTDLPVKLGGCKLSLRDPVTGVCTSGIMRSPNLWLAIICGGIFTAFLMMYRVKGAIIAGTLLVSIISWPRNTPVTYFENDDIGNNRFEFFKQIVTFHPIRKTLLAQDWSIAEDQTGQFFIALATFLYVDILDATGTLYSMARYCGAIDETTQDFEGSAVAYLVDAFSITIGSLFGSSSVTAYIESGAGISEGGATGLTACSTGLCFLVSIFFAPIFASIPPWATGCTLVLVGAMMARACTEINWRYIGDSVPAFLTLAIMPFTYSIAYGLIAGILSWSILNGMAWIITKASSGRYIPHDYEYRDYWTYKVRGGLLPGWVKRLAKGKRDFWREWDFDAEVLTSRNTYAMAKKQRGSGTSADPEAPPQNVVMASWQMPGMATSYGAPQLDYEDSSGPESVRRGS
ncbi:permease family-domain-containing protein [Calycina marina]|uniref:Permease family-domain-containing protein n=1 Tax=Calycina marina TaxID=1763456 RepID=A0A9P8CJP4_9HELO|nr:permease family-domain-containing protein [Calycina marina]